MINDYDSSNAFRSLVRLVDRSIKEMNIFLQNIIDVHEAASILKVSPGHIKNLCAQGKIVSKKIGNTWVIDKSRLRGVKQNDY